MAQGCGNGQVAANAGFGPPSISVVESSTAQVLEEVRRRQMASLSQPAPGPSAGAPPPEPPEEQVAEATPQEEEKAAKPSEEKEPAEKAEKPEEEKTPAEKEPEPKVAKKEEKAKYPPPVSYESAEMPPYRREPKGFYEPAVREYVDGQGKRYAVWGRGFLGWDRHSDLAPGQQENPTRKETTGGGMAGMDWTSHHSPQQTAQVGVFGGYLANRANFSNTFFTLTDTPAVNPAQPGGQYQRTGNTQEVDGGFVGGYLTYRHYQWLGDFAFKTDIFNLSQKSTLSQITSDTGGACNGAGATGQQTGDSSLTTFTLAGNIANRMPHGDDHWWAPTLGFRYAVTNFGSNVSVTNFTSTTAQSTQLASLGLQDGQALRLQGGVRYGGTWNTVHGMWEAEVGALLYSDVWIQGFTFVSTSGGFVSPVDEGKIRGLGQAMAKINVGQGVSYMVMGEIFGGEDLIGLDGQLGVRYEW